MGEGIAIVPTAAEALRNRDSHYLYRFDSYFYYLTGFKEPEALVVLIAGSAPKCILFCREKDMEREVWDGFRYGPAAAQEIFGFDEAYPFSQLDQMMPQLISNKAQLFHSLGANAHWDIKVTHWLNQVKDLARTGISAPEVIRDVRQLVDKQRLLKTPFEIDLMRCSANIAAHAHNRAMQKTKVGKSENEIEVVYALDYLEKLNYEDIEKVLSHKLVRINGLIMITLNERKVGKNTIIDRIIKNQSVTGNLIIFRATIIYLTSLLRGSYVLLEKVKYRDTANMMFFIIKRIK